MAECCRLAFAKPRVLAGVKEAHAATYIDDYYVSSNDKRHGVLDQS